jgi:UDP-galactopyranose mutase
MPQTVVSNSHSLVYFGVIHSRFGYRSTKLPIQFLSLKFPSVRGKHFETKIVYQNEPDDVGRITRFWSTVKSVVSA